jgi:ribosomal protein S12 methylthiotransferase accessory factor
VPTYEAVIYDEISRGFGLNQGDGAHLDPAVAMSRALTEAAMSRAVSIAGSRDEIRWHHYELCKKVDNRKLIQSLESIPATVDVHERQTEATNTFEQDIHLVLKRLKRTGIRQVLVVELTPHVGEFSVVRAIVPGLEGYFNYGYYTPGLRARAFLHHHAADPGYSRSS